MSIYLGFDPGGKEKFGWCISAEEDGSLRTRHKGCGNSAGEVVCEILKVMNNGKQQGSVLAAGIDAPLIWPLSGTRQVDSSIRGALKDAGAKAYAGTVQEVNSLRGACTIQGALLAILLYRIFPDIHISETHPKALCKWCTVDNGTEAVLLRKHCSNFNTSKANNDKTTPHMQDASISAYAAWRGCQSLKKNNTDWVDIYYNIQCQPVYSPMEYTDRLHYFMPNVFSRKASRT